MHYLIDSTPLDTHSGLAISLTVATVLIVLRVALISEPLFFSAINVFFSGLFVPLLLWEFDPEANGLVYGAVSCATSMVVAHLLSLIRK